MRETLFGYPDLVVAGDEVGKLIVTVRVCGRLPLDAGVHVRECYFRAWDYSPLRVGYGTHDSAGDNDLGQQCRSGEDAKG
jgi:hypothetical protein